MLPDYLTNCNVCITIKGGWMDPSGAPVFIRGFSGVRVAQSLVFCVMFCRSFFVLLSFCGHCVVCPSFGHCVVCPSSFGHCVVCPSSVGHCVVCPSIWGFWLSLWYFQAFLNSPGHRNSKLPLNLESRNSAKGHG